jgi:trk system potassium uptake protein TrkH
MEASGLGWLPRWIARVRDARGALVVGLAPLLHVVAWDVAMPRPPEWRAAIAIGAAAAMVGGGLLGRSPALARTLVLGGVVLAFAPAAPAFAERPELLLTTAAFLTAVLSWLLFDPLTMIGASPTTDGGSDGPSLRLRALALGSLATWFVVAMLRPDLGTDRVVACLAAEALGAAAAAIAFLRVQSRVRRAVLALSLLAAPVGALSSPIDVKTALTTLALPSLAVLVFLSPPRSGAATDILDALLAHPARLLVSTFFALCAVGAVLLSIPAASTGDAHAPIDAAFTAVSAVCVTGLIVLDTPNDFSGAGQLIVLLLIQVGGLGIMTFYTAALSAFGRRLSLRHERAVAGALQIEDRRRLARSLGRILTITFVSEIGGALLLFAAFSAGGEPAARALWRAVFTSVSAFCNAGFALQSDSLIPYQMSPLVLHTVATLIVVGGISPAVIVALPAWARRKPVPLQVKLALYTAAALLAGGALLYAGLEWDASLGRLSWADRAHNAWFQSVTLRTAGFNSVDLLEARPAAVTVMIGFMFVGGSPGGTAGGIKTTTFAILILMVVAAIRGRSEIETLGARIGHRSVYRAAAVSVLGVAAGVAAVCAIQITQSMDFAVALFEVVSALGTVGLSIGGTALLDGVGKVIIMACMFAGRVGPLTVFLFLSAQHTESAWRHAETEVDVG